jgi:hypothetical protein
MKTRPPKEYKVYDIKDFIPRKEQLAVCGYDRMISREDIEDLQIKFMETMYGFHKYSLERFILLKEKRPGLQDALKAVDVKEQPIKDKLKTINYCIVFLRLLMDYSCNTNQFFAKKLKDASIEYQAFEYENCKNDINYFINNWCWIHEPRLVRIGVKPSIPFVLYPAQKKILADLNIAFLSGQNLLIEKSREAGITWLASAYCVWHFLFSPDFVAILTSEKEDKIDKLGSRTTLFGKIRHLLYTLPPWMLPTTYKDGYKVTKNGGNDNFMRIINPENGAEVTGETGINIGMSARASMIIIDEAQAISNPEALNTGCISVTDCRVDIGTPRGMNHFGIRRHSAGCLVSTIHWYEDPRKNLNWRDGKDNWESDWWKYTEVTQPNKAILAQEYLLDYAASNEDALINVEWIKAAINFPCSERGKITAGFDVADGGVNRSVYTKKKGIMVYQSKSINFKSPTDNVLTAIRMAKDDGVSTFAYDRDGVGASVSGVMGAIDERLPFAIMPVRGQETPSDRFVEEEGKKAKDAYYNRRAELYYEVMYRFKRTYEHVKGVKLYPEDKLISIPNDPRLIMQLSQPKKKFIGKKLAIESKKDMKDRDVESPDEVDSMVLSHADMCDTDNVIKSFDYTVKKEHYCEYEVNPLESFTERYVSIFHTKKDNVAAIGASWSATKNILKVFWMYGQDFDGKWSPEDIVFNAKGAMRDDVKEIREWIGNDVMFEGIKDSRHCEYYHYKKAGINLKQNYEYDERGLIISLDKMFENDMIQIKEPDCENLMLQINNLKIGKATNQDEYILVGALCQLIARLKSQKKISFMNGTFAGYGRVIQTRGERMVLSGVL